MDRLYYPAGQWADRRGAGHETVAAVSGTGAFVCRIWDRHSADDTSASCESDRLRPRPRPTARITAIPTTTSTCTHRYRRLMPWFHVQFIACNALRSFCAIGPTAGFSTHLVENIHGRNTFASWMFSKSLESLQLLHNNCSALHATVADETTA